jgi:hypothetical protein
MGKVLNASEVENFRETGIQFPVNAFTESEVAGLLGRLEATEAHDGGRLAPHTNRKPHLLLPWANELIRHPRILDAVEDVLGPNLMCWSSQFFAKDAHDPAFISWHQDATYWGLSTTEVLTVWLALTPSTRESGCMQVVPGTHKGQVEHRDTFGESNMLTRGQEIAVEVRAEDVVNVILQPGQFSMHNVLLFHGSEPNRSSHRRIGYAMRFIPTHIKQTISASDSATLVRGVDSYGHFEHEPAPLAEFDPQAVAYHRAVVERQLSLVYNGAKEDSKRQAVLASRN